MPDDPPLSQINIIRERHSDGQLSYKITLFTKKECCQVIYTKHRVLVPEAIAEIIHRLEPIQ